MREAKTPSYRDGAVMLRPDTCESVTSAVGTVYASDLLYTSGTFSVAAGVVDRSRPILKECKVTSRLLAEGWLNPYPVFYKSFHFALTPARAERLGTPHAAIAGPVSATAGWAIRVPLLACPAVSNHYQTQHCWASRQWQPRESSIAVCVRHYTRMSRKQGTSPPATASEATKCAEGIEMG